MKLVVFTLLPRETSQLRLLVKFTTGKSSKSPIVPMRVVEPS
jgi:hypothetical protein